MTRFATDLINVAIGRETTRGTGVAPTFGLPFATLDFDDMIEKAQNKSSLGTIDAVQNAAITKVYAQGSIKGIVYRNSIGAILTNLAGQVSTDTVVETTAKKHVWTILNTNVGSSSTLVKKDPNANLRFVLAILDELQIDYVTNNYIQYSAKFISQGSASGSDTISYATETEFIPQNVVLKTAAVGITNLGAASAYTNIRSFSINIKKTAKGTDALGTTALENVVNTDFITTGKLERYLDDTTFKGYWQNNTHRSMRVDLIDTNDIVGAVTNPSLRFDMDNIIFTNRTEKRPNSDITTEEFDWTAIRDPTSGKTISTIELVNDVASY